MKLWKYSTEIYLGTFCDPRYIKTNHLGQVYSPDSLLPRTTFYWKIIAKDGNSNKTIGPVWRFRTGQLLNRPLSCPHDPFLPDGTTEVPIN